VGKSEAHDLRTVLNTVRGKRDITGNGIEKEEVEWRCCIKEKNRGIRGVKHVRSSETLSYAFLVIRIRRKTVSDQNSKKKENT